MNLCLFFEGTGRGVAGCITNVTRLRDLCVDDSRQKLHLEAGPGTHFGSYLAGKIAGVDWRTTFRSARRWFEANYETLPKDGIATKVFLFGFSRGALIARHFAAWRFSPIYSNLDFLDILHMSQFYNGAQYLTNGPLLECLILLTGCTLF